MFNNRSIKKQVMKVINKKIDDAQKEYDTKVLELTQTHKKAVRNLALNLEVNKDTVRDGLVSSIIGKALS